MNRNNIWHVLLLLLIPGIQSCQKEVLVKDDNSSTFIKTYESDINESGVSLNRTSDNGLLITSLSWDLDQLHVLKANEFGTLQFKKSIPIITPDFFPLVTKIGNGDFIINAFFSTEIMRISENGEIKWIKVFDPGLPYNFPMSKVVESNDQRLYLSYTNGLGSGAPSQNYISQIDPSNGKELEYSFYYDSEFGPGKVLQFFIYRAENDMKWVIGSKFTSNNWEFGDPSKIFIAKLDNFSVSSEIIDDLDGPKRNLINAYSSTNDGGVVCAVQSIWWASSRFESEDESLEVIRFDENADLKWRKKVKINAYALSVTGMRELPNKEIILNGYCSTKESTTLRPFVVKLNSNGEKMFERIFNINGNGEILSGLQAENGDLYFTGYSDGFGNGKQKSNIMLIRTNAAGEIN